MGTVALVDAVGGLYADVDGLPMQVGLQREREMRLVDEAVNLLRQEYPQLRATSFSVESETRVLLWVERI